MSELSDAERIEVLRAQLDAAEHRIDDLLAEVRRGRLIEVRARDLADDWASRVPAATRVRATCHWGAIYSAFSLDVLDLLKDEPA